MHKQTFRADIMSVLDRLDAGSDVAPAQLVPQACTRIQAIINKHLVCKEREFSTELRLVRLHFASI